MSSKKQRVRSKMGKRPIDIYTGRSMIAPRRHREDYAAGECPPYLLRPISEEDQRLAEFFYNSLTDELFSPQRGLRRYKSRGRKPTAAKMRGRAHTVRERRRPAVPSTLF